MSILRISRSVARAARSAQRRIKVKAHSINRNGKIVNIAEHYRRASQAAVKATAQRRASYGAVFSLKERLNYRRVDRFNKMSKIMGVPFSSMSIAQQRVMNAGYKAHNKQMWRDKARYPKYKKGSARYFHKQLSRAFGGDWRAWSDGTRRLYKRGNLLLNKKPTGY